MTLVNGMQVKKAQGRAEVVYDGCQPLVAVENGLKLDWQSWEAAENKKPSASQQQRITVLARGPPSLAGTPTHWHLCNASHMGGHPIAAEAPHDFNPGPIVLTHPPPDGASFWKEASRMHRRRKKHSLAGAGLAGAERSSSESSRRRLAGGGPSGGCYPPPRRGGRCRDAVGLAPAPGEQGGGRGKSATPEGPTVAAALGKVHDLQGFRVDGDRSGQCHHRPVVPVARLVAAFTTVVLLLDKVVAGTEGHQVCVVGRCGDGD